jgi:hypothetical protein
VGVCYVEDGFRRALIDIEKRTVSYRKYCNNRHAILMPSFHKR